MNFQLIQAANKEEWLLNRRLTDDGDPVITASDVAVIMGDETAVKYSGYNYIEKHPLVALAEEKRSGERQEFARSNVRAMDIGTANEETCAKEFCIDNSQFAAIELPKYSTAAHVDQFSFRATVDRLLMNVDNGRIYSILECKCVTNYLKVAYRAAKLRFWEWQQRWQMYVTQSDACYMSAMLISNKRDMLYATVDHDQDIEDKMVAEVYAFWIALKDGMPSEEFANVEGYGEYVATLD